MFLFLLLDLYMKIPCRRLVLIRNCCYCFFAVLSLLIFEICGSDLFMYFTKECLPLSHHLPLLSLYLRPDCSLYNCLSRIPIILFICSNAYLLSFIDYRHPLTLKRPCFISCLLHMTSLATRPDASIDRYPFPERDSNQAINPTPPCGFEVLSARLNV